MEIIPAIDIIGGQCVRLSQGDYSRRKTYSDDPVSVARQFEDAGIRRLHLVDLDGAREKTVVNLEVLRAIAFHTNLLIDFGGGIATDSDLQNVLDAGAGMVTGGSIAVRDPEKFTGWIRTYGPDRIILGADVRDRKIAIGAWTETSERDILEFIGYYQKKSIKFVICTDVSRDGVLTGPATGLYREILLHFPDIRLIASGGVSSAGDLEELEQAGVWGVIIGKAIYEGKIKLEELKPFLTI
jgi:phosphoribosylformimino-5-aminoimidazole carboxamide ribotide isomerase